MKKKLILIASFCISAALNESIHAQTITTIAGTYGAIAFVGDGGAASIAKVKPQSVVKDAAGNLYVADAGYFRIRKIDASGIISTIAGTGTPGFSGDGGAATAANMITVEGICRDAAGNIYITDGANHRIRKISATGIITTIAGTGMPGWTGDGGPASAATLKQPSDIAIDAGGKLYIADKGNHVIRVISSTGTISTLAGSGAASFFGDGGAATDAYLSSPSGVAVDAAGNVYIADQVNARVRMVNTAGTISTVAGTGTFGYTGDGIAATASQLYQPNKVCVDAAGNLLIADQGNNRVRKVNTSGIISTIAGTGTADFSGDAGPATAAQLDHPSAVYADATGNVYITDALNNRIRMINSAGIITTVCGVDRYIGDGGPATNADLITPADIAIDKYENLYFTESNGHRVRKISADGIITTYAGTGTEGTTGDGGMATDAAITSPAGIAMDTSGNLYFTDKNNRVRKVSPAGIIGTIAGTGTTGYTGDGGPAIAAQINVQNIHIDSLGNMYISQSGNGVVRKIDPSGTITTIAGSGILAYGGDGGSATEAQLNYPHGVATDADGNIFIAEKTTSVVRKVTPAGDIFTIAGNATAGFSGDGGPATAAQLGNPGNVTFVGDKLIISDEFNARIRMVDTDGTITTIAGTGTTAHTGDGGPATAASMWAPLGIVGGNDKNTLYIVDLGGFVIRKISNLDPTLPPTNVNEPLRTGKTALFPNPVTTEVRLYAANAIREVSVTNVVGQQLIQKKYNSKNIAIDVADLVPGIYFIRINNRETLKFVKQ